MIRYTVALSAFLFLSACANIEHKTPEARQQIKQDLKLIEITDTALTSFCWLSIGGIAHCKYTPGISVLTPDSLLLVDYEKGAYVQKDVIKTDNVKCISDGDGQNFYIFTEHLAVSLIPYTEVHRSLPINNPEYREKAIKMLLSNGQPYLTGAASAISRETGRKEYQVRSVYTASGPIPIVTGTELREIVSPCPSGDR